MAGAEIRRYSTDRRGLTLNVFLGIAGGALAALAETLVLPIIVLSFFVGQLTNSFVVVGLVPAFGIGLWLVARLPATILVSPRRRKLPWAIGASLIRAAATALLAAICFRAGQQSQPQLLRAFFICYVTYCLASGFASVPTAAVVAKAIPHDGRPLFFRQRNLWGGVAGVIAGIVIAQLLGDGAPAFPRNYALLFLAATVCQTATAFFIATLREPVRVSTTRVPVLSLELAAVPKALADPNYRRFALFRILLSFASLADPFFVIFAVSELAVKPRIVGWYVIAFVLGRLLSTPFWIALSRRSGERTTLQVASLVRLLAPLIALMLPFVVGTNLYREHVSDSRTVAVIFGLAFLALGVSLAGQAQANYAYVAEFASERFHPTYVGLTNALLAIVAFAPVIGGMLIERFNYPILFLIAAMVGLMAVFASGALTDTHVRTRRAAAVWRLRRPATPIPVQRHR